MHSWAPKGYLVLAYLSHGLVSIRIDVFSFKEARAGLGREVMDKEGRVMRAGLVEAFGGSNGSKEGWPRG